MKLLSGAEYFVIFIDDKSRYVWVYVLKHKSEVGEVHRMENHSGEIEWKEIGKSAAKR